MGVRATKSHIGFIAKLRAFFKRHNMECPPDLTEARSGGHLLLQCVDCATPVKKSADKIILRPNNPPRCRSCVGKHSNNPTSQAKFKATCQERFGVPNPFNSQEVQERIKDDRLKKYGTKNLQEIPEVKNKRIQTVLKRYGEEYTFLVPKFQEKAKATNLEKYGFPNVSSSPEVKQKIKEVVLVKYGEASYPEVRQRERYKDLGYENKAEFTAALIDFIEKNNFPVYADQVAKQFKYNRLTIAAHIKAAGREDLLYSGSSGKEAALAERVANLVGAANVVRNSRLEIAPKELDIFLPEHNLAIEFNGLYWHSEVRKPKGYHFEKREACEARNIQLLQFFEDEWDQKAPIIESIIKQKLKITENRIFARKTEIRQVEPKKAAEFLTANHLMGAYKTAKHTGLYLKGELVCIISYRRQGKGLDISRFCNKLNTSVVGGLSKLLKFLETNLAPEFIQSFVDLRYGNGDSLQALNFKLEGVSLGWKWTDFRGTYNRLSCRANMDSRRLSEKQHAEELGRCKIYDAGQAKWVKWLI